MMAREQLKLLLNSTIPIDDSDLVHFCKKIIVECEERQKNYAELVERQKRLSEAREQYQFEQEVEKINSGQSILDAAYNPLSINDDYFFATTPTPIGKGVGFDIASIEIVPDGGTAIPIAKTTVGEIADLIYYSRKKCISLPVPAFYMNLGKGDGGFTLDDLGDEG